MVQEGICQSLTTSKFLDIQYTVLSVVHYKQDGTLHLKFWVYCIGVKVFERRLANPDEVIYSF